MYMLLMRKCQEQGQQAAFRVTVATVVRQIAIQLFDIIRDLTLQESKCIRALQLQQPQVRKVANDGFID